MTNILFICDFGESRSKYFAEQFKNKCFETAYRGFCDEAERVLNIRQIEWADVIVVLSDTWMYVKEYEDYLLEANKLNKKVIHYMIPDEPQYFNEHIDKIERWLIK